MSRMLGRCKLKTCRYGYGCCDPHHSDGRRAVVRSRKRAEKAAVRRETATYLTH